MATDVNFNNLVPIDKDRNSKDNYWLSPISLCRFISKKFSEGWNNTGVTFHPGWPKKDINDIGVAYRIVHRTPGVDRIDTIKPSLKGSYYSSRNKEVIELYTQFQTITYEFIIYGLDDIEVDNLIESFEEFLYLIVSDLKKMNVSQFFFQEELDEGILNPGVRTENVYKRILRYQAIIEKKFEFSFNSIESFSISTGVFHKKKEDVVMYRDSKTRVDFIEEPISETVTFLMRVSDLKNEDLISAYVTATGNTADYLISAEHVYISGQDYIFCNYYDESNDTYKKAIVWKNSEGSRNPLPSNKYYISWYEPNSKINNNILRE